jgi:CIC family chloride channel protein
VHARARLVAALVAVAVGTALFAVAFRASLAFVYRSLYGAANVVEAITGLPWPLRIVAAVVAAGVAGLIASFRRGGTRQNVSNVMEAVALGNVRLSLRATLTRVSASWAAIAGGLSIGREGPLIEFGGTLGATCGRLARVPLSQTRALVAAGTAAGFAAAYNTPFAAALFVLETMVGIAALEALMPIMVATVIATSIMRAIVGGGPIYGQRMFVLASPWEVVSCGALGIVAAGAALLFKQLLAIFERWMTDHPLAQPWRAMAGGLLVGLIAVVVPDVAGNGYEPLNRLLDGQVLAETLVILMIAKMLATSSSVASGVPGGVFTPVLLTGGVIGSLWGHVATIAWGSPAASAGSYALVGMAATTAASIHAPLTAAVLVFELSGDYGIVLPLLFATVVATLLSRALRSDSVYEAELRRRGIKWEMTLEGRIRPTERRVGS